MILVQVKQETGPSWKLHCLDSDSIFPDFVLDPFPKLQNSNDAKYPDYFLDQFNFDFTSPPACSIWDNVFFEVSFQIACLRWCIVAFVAFVCLFSTVGFHMFPQIACVIWCISTLVAFIWFFSALCHFHWILIGCAFTKISCFKIEIHFQLIRSVLSLAILVSNWKHIGFGL